MDGADAGALIVIIFLVILVIWAVKKPSERSLEKQRREREHEIEMTRLDQEREELASQPSIPSGRGKVVKARKG